MENTNSEEADQQSDQQEHLERMWDEFEAWCRANENAPHE
jgi:hypothetical protein